MVGFPSQQIEKKRSPRYDQMSGYLQEVDPGALAASSQGILLVESDRLVD